MSANEWDADASLTEETVQKIVNQTYPEMARLSVNYLGEGWDFRAFLIGDIVFRFPKREEYVPYFRFERALLNAYHDRFPIAVPHYLYALPPSGLFPYEGGGYPILKGESGHHCTIPVPNSEAKRLAEMLNSLHSITREEIDRLGFLGNEDSGSTGAYESIEDDLDQLKGQLDADLFTTAERAYQNLRQLSIPESPTRCLTHSDLLPEHVILDPSNGIVKGIIDWADVEWGDPTSDFVGIWLWCGDKFTEEVIQNYHHSLDDGFWPRLKLRGLRASLSHANYGHQSGKDDYRQEGERWLRDRYSNG